MPCEEHLQFLVLYGSQRGQAQSIAEGIGDQAREEGLSADVFCLSQQDKYNLERQRDPVVFVVSTTGDGDPPDTALTFVKNIKRKTLAADHYAHLHYALLGLGDTNYANFCNCGKTIDKRLQELGGKHFYATGHADDAVGLELVVDPWLEGLWDAIKGAYSKMASQESIGSVGDSQTPDLRDSIYKPSDYSTARVQLNLLSLSNATVQSSDLAGVISEQGSTQAQSSPLSETQCGDTVAPSAVEEASLTCSLPPLSKTPLNVPALPPPYLEVKFLEATTELASSPLSTETVHEVPIFSAVRLTSDDSVKTALLLGLDISDHPLAYQPGDSFDVLCPNRVSEVEQLLERLGLQEHRNSQLQLSLRQDTKKKAALLPPYVPEICSLLYLFTWCMEIRSVPKKAFLRALVEWTADTGQKRRLQELSSKQGCADYNLYVRDSSLGLLDLLTAFPSCSPPLSLLIEQVPKLQPRAYSAASSSLQHPGKLHFVFNVVEFPASPWCPAGRRGLCTGWLYDLVQPLLVHLGKEDSSSVWEPPKVYVSLRSRTSFHLPSDPAAPLIMVGPGTGVAPFIGFLQQREKERGDHPQVVFGETWLFYGCRHRDKDFLFREELQGFVVNGSLTHLEVCCSRDSQGQEEPRYVQHNLLLQASHICNILFQQKGFLYVCGDAKNMAKDVNDTLIDLVSAELHVDKLEAMKKLASLREDKRYLQDIWS